MKINNQVAGIESSIMDANIYPTSESISSQLHPWGNQFEPSKPTETKLTFFLLESLSDLVKINNQVAEIKSSITDANIYPTYEAICWQWSVKLSVHSNRQQLSFQPKKNSQIICRWLGEIDSNKNWARRLGEIDSKQK